MASADVTVADFDFLLVAPVSDGIHGVFNIALPPALSAHL